MSQNNSQPSLSEETPTRMSELRQGIDAVDRELLTLLNRRAAFSLEVGRLKRDQKDIIFKPFREKELLTKLIAANPGPLPEEHLRTIYREILSSSRRLQRPQTIVYLGPEGTFSYFAGVEYLGHSGEFRPKPTLHEVFTAIVRKEAELGVIPLENSLQGTVGQSLDLFLQFEVHVQAEIYCKISHALLSTARQMADVKRVYSHPQALEQCSAWLRAQLPTAGIVPAESTAAAARRVLEEPDSAAIGHVRLGQMLGLTALAQRIEDQPDNWTRFLVIGSVPAGTGNQDKTSILFTLPDKPGSLAAVLNLLAREGINMKKLESRPFRGEKWKYVFFVDLECDISREEYQRVLADLRDNCHTLRILGSYPSGPYLDVSADT
ncbi:chorismate mutase / prephenate dehydratase [Desulfonatronum thiosulfatophilum]|uniref:Bifunctional chorismate mutase/prephenate dehydratase n=1 Tax=Desulfonatronum thiosulfatophilum TaxID=617002 RepID=A0A1G6B214_9BACT|nr:prephenate dehydratase [Desulfonatronum thiosulfatophilum]SDB14533.1 chorismate mutase / prephenate dehydratase [Desulfonatronum thiosulfatophilum]